MCGIFCEISKNHKIEFDSFINSLNLLEHRGPDNTGYFLRDFIALGSKRLKIHDLSDAGNQPLLSSCGNYQIIFNGAIYNFREIKKQLISKGIVFKTETDTEVILEGYAHYGSKILDFLEGMFAFIILDIARNKVFIARDSFGIKPLYIYEDKGHVIFSSEIKPILRTPGTKLKFKKSNFDDFLLFQSTCHPKTFFDGIEVFSPATYMEIDLTTFEKTSKKYWELGSYREDIHKEDTEEIILESISQCWDTDRNTGVQLSGGVDSSLMVALLRQQNASQRISTYSVDFDDSKIKYWYPRSERKYINQVKTLYDCETNLNTFTNNEISDSFIKSIYFFEAPLFGASTAMYYLFANKIKRDVTVLLTGEGVDDIFLGYFDDWHFNHNISSLAKGFVSEYTAKLLLDIDSNTPLLENKILEILGKDFDLLTHRQKATILLIKNGLQGLLARHDKMFMSASIEGRPPFLSKKLVEKRFSLNDDDIHSESIGKKNIKGIASNYYDAEFVYRPKIGFSSPYGDWLADEKIWGKYLRDLNLDLFSDLLNVDRLKEIIDIEDPREKFSGNNLNILMSLTSFQAFYSIFFENVYQNDSIEIPNKNF
tara:strand:+ start:3043 stop:4833 length:1791 start_codon:yes stop_codon:yes gene_type:complete